LILVLLEWAAIVALVIVVIWLFRLRRRRQLVVSAFLNASGLPELDTTVQGLGQLLRERLVRHLQITQRQLRESVERTGLSSTPMAAQRAPMPVGEPDQRAKELVASLKAYVPQTAGPAVQLLSDVFLRPAGSKVTGTVQRGGSPEFGITLELTDLGGSQSPSIETIWEAAETRAAAGDKQSVGRQAGSSDGLHERLAALLDPAARLTARRVVALELICAHRKRERSPQDHEALVRNFIGMLLQGDALQYRKHGHATFFFEQAIREFDRAAEVAPKLYQPYENRADTAAIQAQVDPGRAGRLLPKAIGDYETALQRAQALSDSGTKAQVVHRLQIGQMLTQRRLNDPPGVPVAVERIPELERVAASELDDQFLYNLACWFGFDYNLRQEAATASRQRWWRTLLRRPPLAEPERDAEAKALRYLAYCLARAVTEERAEDRAKGAQEDSDLSLIKDKVPRLCEKLVEELRRDPGLRTTRGQPFVDSIDRVLVQVCGARPLEDVATKQ
jgi:hypothetical protein